MDQESKTSVCGLLKEAIVSFCKDNYSSSDLDIDGIICVSFKDSFQQHIVQIHDKLKSNKENHGNDIEVVNTSSKGHELIGYGSNNNPDWSNKNESIRSNDCCFACLKERGDNSRRLIKTFGPKFTKFKETSKLIRKFGPPPLFNSRSKIYSESTKNGGNNSSNISQNPKPYQEKRKLKITQQSHPSDHNKNYPATDNISECFSSDVTAEVQQDYPNFAGDPMVQNTKDRAESVNTVIDNSVSRSVCVENDSMSRREKVVVKLELTDDENNEEYQVTINDDNVSASELDNINSEIDSNNVMQESGNHIDESPLPCHTESWISQDKESADCPQENVTFDIDNLAQNLKSEKDSLQTEMVSADSMMDDISCIVTGDNAMQLVHTRGDKNFNQPTHDSWGCPTSSSNNYDLNSCYNEMTSDQFTNSKSDTAHSSQYSGNQSSHTNQTSGAKVNFQFSFHNKMYRKKMLPSQRQFASSKGGMNIHKSVPFRKIKIHKPGSEDYDSSTREKKYHCQHCGLGFTTTGNKTRHERTTCGKSVYKCDICDTNFSRSDSKTRHMLVRHGIAIHSS